MVGNNLCIGYTPQRCWAVGQVNQERFNRDWLSKHDFEQFSIGPLISYRGIPKIPPEKYPEVAKEYSIMYYNYLGVEYVSIRKLGT